MIHLKQHLIIDMYRRALNILEPIFENHILAENGQNILGEQKHWTTLLNMIPDKGIFYSRYLQRGKYQYLPYMHDSRIATFP